MDISNLGDLAKQMQDAYSSGTSAMNQAGKEVAKDIKPDHEIEVNIKLSADIEGHKYKVDGKIIFEIELDPILESQSGDLASALEGLNVDLGEDKDAVLEQLGQPRAVGIVKKIDLKEIHVENDDGQVKTNLNKDGTILVTIDGKKLRINFESVLSYPNNSDLYIAIPSMEEMQKNIFVDIKKIESKISFNWIEKDKDNLKIEGSLKLSKI
ncbi:MAG: hypothetical protein PHE21_03360 [Candidatus Dojkabacteria bacterium]|nr:hypothetical protein [Candidatus Dojkabacteria bacterium]